MNATDSEGCTSAALLKQILMIKMMKLQENVPHDVVILKSTIAMKTKRVPRQCEEKVTYHRLSLNPLTQLLRRLLLQLRYLREHERVLLDLL